MYYEDSHIKVYNKSCTDMSELEDNSIQCCVTSPPYWGLRKYDGNQCLIWGGDKNCQHEWTITPPRRSRKAGDIKNPDSKEATNGGNLGQELTPTNTCSICNAWKGAYGLEPTPELYVAHSIEILREIKRVLRPDGVVFWNIGDSYMAHAGDRNKVGGFQANPDKNRLDAESSMSMTKRTTKTLKDKDLCLIPFRVALAAQQDGWWIRSVIIWNKPNPMPESVKDRPTDAYEHVLMMTKSSRYYWDIDAVREPYTEPMNRWGGDNLKANGESTWDIGTGQDTYRDRNMRPNDGGRNLRNVWTFPTQPYPEAHFATFPEKLPETCIKAASKEGDIVLDTFAGSGTTLWVAKKLGRKAVGYELSEKYCNLIVDRNRQQVF